jgi:hypothetical protein
VGYLELHSAFLEVLQPIFYQMTCLFILCSCTIMSLGNISFFSIMLWVRTL